MKNKKYLIAIVIIIFLVALVSYFFYKQNASLKELIDEKQNHWNLLLYQNTTVSGDMMGFFYDNNVNINTLPKEYTSFLLTEYYIQNSEDFFTEENHLKDSTYQKSISYNELINYLYKMFGPDYQAKNIHYMSYGCGRSLSQNTDGSLLITANDPESCGIFDDNKDQYISHITDYFKEKDKIIINLKVAFMTTTNEGRIVLYSNKNKSQVINYGYQANCLGSEDEACYNDFLNFQVTLKKASDRNYYFYSIVKA